MLIESIMEAITTFILFSLIPLLWWFFTGKKKEKLFLWLGLKKPEVKNVRVFILMAGLITICPIIINNLITIVESSETASGRYDGLGMSALLPAIIWSMFTTGLMEEIFFRGFMAKRFIKQFGFGIGNLIQAVLFGFLHIVMFYAATSISLFQGIMIFLIPCFYGWLMGYVNEKHAGGSIVPSWLFHGCGNLIVSIIAMFALFN